MPRTRPAGAEGFGGAVNDRGLVVGATLVVLLLALRTAGASDWPQWRGPGRDGVWSETGILQKFPAEGLTVGWRVPVGPGYSSPIVAHGRVYLTDAQLTPPTAQEHLRCFAEFSGKPLWTFSYPVKYPDFAFSPAPGMGPTATPVADAGKVYSLGAMGDLFCLDALGGKVLWKKDLAKEYGAREFTLNASPVVEEDLLILFVGGKPGACVVALDPNSGREVWRALNESSTNSTPAVIDAGNKRQVIAWTQESVTALDPLTGRTCWRLPLRTGREYAVSTPVAHGDLLLVGGLMLKLNADATGVSIQWPNTKATSARVLSNTSTAMFRDDCVFSAKSSGELVCLEAATGRQAWQTDRVTDLVGGASIHLTTNGDSELLYTDRGELIRATLSATGYQEMGRCHVLEPTYPFAGRKVAWPPPAFANRHVFARSDHELVCASLESGKSGR